MKVKAIKTRKFLPPKDNLWELLSTNIKSLKENSVVAVTSKVVSIGEGRSVAVEKTTKDELAMMESDKYIPRDDSPGGWVLHTIKNNMLIASAGVDESNGAGYFILWPTVHKHPAKKYGIFYGRNSILKIWELLLLIPD